MIEPPLQWQVVQAVLDPIKGSEQAGLRPVLIISREPINLRLPVVAVLPLTTLRPGRRIRSTEVLLPAGTAGQPNESIILAHQIRTLSKERFGRSYGYLIDPALRREVQRALAVYLDLES
ncbi:MAG: type II toxin-antitoxin system PemK/MazF family toxin [Proteobacteria bacterium]|nr:type II toxin-antitoxin system PemK/MazF family toxin [Pseudomonadota bacterium]